MLEEGYNFITCRKAGPSKKLVILGAPKGSKKEHGSPETIKKSSKNHLKSHSKAIQKPLTHLREPILFLDAGRRVVPEIDGA